MKVVSRKWTTFSSNLTCLSVVFLVIVVHDQTFAFSVSRSRIIRRRGSRRYFEQQLVLPPLQRVDDDDESSFPNDSSSITRSLPVLYTNNPKTVAQWLADQVPSAGCTLGFDVESVPDAPWMTKKASFCGPATVQLARPTPDAALVVQLTRLDGRSCRACAPLLDAVLGDELIVKAGCSVDQDMLELRQCWKGSGLEAKSRLDLSGIGAVVGRETVGLKTLTSGILGLHLRKSRRLATSNWSQVPLSKAQVAYSARDAWAGAAIVARLADLDPETFDTRALVERLRSQRSLKDLQQRLVKRKQAKKLLSFLHQTRLPSAELSSWKVMIIEELRTVVKNNRHEKNKVFDGVELLSTFQQISNE